MSSALCWCYNVQVFKPLSRPQAGTFMHGSWGPAKAQLRPEQHCAARRGGNTDRSETCNTYILENRSINQWLTPDPERR